MTGVPADQLTDESLERELEHLHQTRHDTFLHGSEDALALHTTRTTELEQDYLRRNPDRVMRLSSRSGCFFSRRWASVLAYAEVCSAESK